MKKSNSIRRKLLTIVIIVVVVTVVMTTVIKTVSDISFRSETDEILLDEAMSSAEVFVSGQTKAVNEQIVSITEKITRTASFTEYVYEHSDEFVSTHNKRPSEFSEDTTGVTFHWSAFNEEDVGNEAIIKEADMLSALESEFSSLSETCPIIQSLYVATDSHINIGYDENVLAKVGSFYNPIESNAKWFLEPMKSGEVYISDTYSDVFGRGLLVTVAAPYRVDGKVHGVIGADINIGNIEKDILDIDADYDTGYAVLLTRDGDPICAKGLDEKTTAKDVIGSNYKKALEIFKAENSGFVESMIKSDEKYVVFNTVESTGWKLAIILSVDEILEPTKNIDRMMVRITVVSILIIIALLCIMYVVVDRLCRNFTRPIINLSDEVAKIGDGNLDYRSTIHTGDEIERLSDSFENMTVSLKQYIDNLTRVTAEKERIGAELDVAANIQASMLPCIFPPYPDRDEFDIYATMTPAKEVGGDFYDFFMVDQNHVAIVMADVSGKGVPAALFMVIAKTLIKDHSQVGKELGDVFTDVNELLCQSNSQGLFVTAFEGVLDLVTGEFVFVNAGHEMPFICKNGGKYEPYKIRPGFVLAGMEGMKYKAGSFTIEPGCKIFQYTDGVTEATNSNNELFGMDRLEATLAANSDKSPIELLPAVKADIDAFVGEAPQFDDITMLCLEYKKRGEIQ